MKQIFHKIANRGDIKFLLIIILMLFILRFYWDISYSLEKNKYEPLESRYNTGFWFSDQECIIVHDYYMEIDGRNMETHNWVTFERNCSETKNFNIILTSPGIIKYNLGGDKEVIKNNSILNKDQMLVEIDFSKVQENKAKQLEIKTTNNFEFYSIYDVSNKPRGHKQQLDFLYDGEKYICEEGCIAITQGSVEPQPILKREEFIRAKIIKWSGRRLSFIFAPQKVDILLWSKVTDRIFLGLVVTVFYALVFRPLLRKFRMDD